MMARMKSDPNIDRPTAITLPRMSFFLDGYHYDDERKRNTINQYFYRIGDTANRNRQFEEVPYKFYFSLFVYVKNAEDATKIVEQILPFFTPEFTVRAFLIPDHAAFDLPIKLIEVTHEFSDPSNYTENSTLIWTLRFEVKSAFFGPRMVVPLIVDANVGLYLGTWGEANTVNIDSYGVSAGLLNRVVANTYLMDWTDVRAGVTNSGGYSADPNNFIYTTG